MRRRYVWGVVREQLVWVLIYIFRQPYVEQAAKDKTRAENEKAAYDVRFLSLGLFLSHTDTIPLTRARMALAAVRVKPMKRLTRPIPSLPVLNSYHMDPSCPILYSTSHVHDLSSLPSPHLVTCPLLIL